ncbi:BON domain-containing protein [Candidatus Nitrospira bockiana]
MKTACSTGLVLGGLLVFPLGLGTLDGHAAETVPLVDQKSTGPRDDEMLSAKLEEKLRMDGRINWGLLAVAVKDGQVTLYGVVKTPEEEGLATRIVMSEPGVKAVQNSLVVEPSLPETEKKPDLTDKDGKAVLEGEGQIKEQQVLP